MLLTSSMIETIIASASIDQNCANYELHDFLMPLEGIELEALQAIIDCNDTRVKSDFVIKDQDSMVTILTDIMNITQAPNIELWDGIAWLPNGEWMRYMNCSYPNDSYMTWHRYKRPEMP